MTKDPKSKKVTITIQYQFDYEFTEDDYDFEDDIYLDDIEAEVEQDPITWIDDHSPDESITVKDAE